MRLEHLLSGESAQEFEVAKSDRCSRQTRSGYNDRTRIGTTLKGLLKGGLAQLARAPALQAGGQRFESVILHNEKENIDKLEAKRNEHEQQKQRKDEENN